MISPLHDTPTSLYPKSGSFCVALLTIDNPISVFPRVFTRDGSMRVSHWNIYESVLDSQIARVTSPVIVLCPVLVSVSVYRIGAIGANIQSQVQSRSIRMSLSASGSISLSSCHTRSAVYVNPGTDRESEATCL